MLTSSALVLLMTAPGLAFFYGGMVRRKNVLATVMQSFILMAVISVQSVLFGYSLAFGPDIGHLVGSLRWFGLNEVGLTPNPDYAATIPHQAFMVFQLMFAIITPALITGAFAERMRFGAFLLFITLWATFIYDPLAHWVWGTGGWLRNLGALDFAGGTLVHISSGVSALACALLMGHRKGYGAGADAAPQPAVHGDGRGPCSGSAGSASTPAARSGPAAWRRAPAWPPTRRRPSAGLAPSGSSPGSRPFSAPRPAQWRGW